MTPPFRGINASTKAGAVQLAAGHPQGPGLDTGEDGATITSRDAGHPQKCNDVPRHLLTVSRDITLAHPEGFEPPTF